MFNKSGDSIAAIAEDHEAYRVIGRNAYMQQLFDDREAYRRERDDCRKRGDSTMAHSLNARIANCTRKMNLLMMQWLDERIHECGLAQKK